MSKPDLSGRTPTVQRAPAFPWPRWRPARPRAIGPIPRQRQAPVPDAQHPPMSPTVPRVPRTGERIEPENLPPRPVATSRSTGSLAGWLLRESIALLGMAGAALTVFTQLAWFLPISRPFMDVLGWWMTASSNFWLAHYDSLGFYPHAHLQAAIALAAFLTLIGLGARVSAVGSGPPLERRWGFLQGMTWPSLAIMGVLAIVFLLGHDPDASTASYEGAGGKETIKYLFAIILTVGYAAGDFLGQRGFHIRLYRLAVLLILGLALNQWLLSSY